MGTGIYDPHGEHAQRAILLVLKPLVQPQLRAINENQAQMANGGEITIIIRSTLGRR